MAFQSFFTIIVNHLFPISCTHDLPSLIMTLFHTRLQLLKEINRTSISRALRIRRQASQSEPRAYVTAGYKTLPLQFTLGDGQNYGDFRNRPLLNGQEYVFFVLALLDLSENVSQTLIRSCRWKILLFAQPEHEN